MEGWTAVPVCAECFERARPFGPAARCGGCGVAPASALALDHEGRCAACLLDPRPWEGLRSFGPYGGALRRLIHLLKYDGMEPLGPALGRLLAAPAAELAPFDVIAPVPLHRGRRIERGFNQAELLGRGLARETGCSLEPDLLVRRRPTAPQAGLNARERRTNLRGSFAAPRPEAVRGRKILLIDDVTTTGATLEACARALKRAGAGRVVVLTLARADLEGREL